jgi:hypothetical protein
MRHSEHALADSEAEYSSTRALDIASNFIAENTRRFRRKRIVSSARHDISQL